MSQHLTQEQIVEITGYSRQKSQETALREMGYIVLRRRNAKNEVQALATHPEDPNAGVASNDQVDEVKLNLV